MTVPELSVVVPAFNEQSSIAATSDAIRHAGGSTTLELVLVNDGSTDETSAAMHRIKTGSPTPVVVVDCAVNGGLGRALASGLDAATGDLVTWIPGDGEYDLAEVLAARHLLDDHDVVLIRRTARGQLGRNVVSSAMYLLIKALFGFDARGYCGIFLMPRSTYESLAVESRDVFFTLEVALRARRQRLRIAYATAEWIPRREGRSKVFKLSTIVRNVGELLAFRWRLLRNR